MFIKKICNYYNEASEADVIVSDGTNDIRCYAMPFENKRKTDFLLFGLMANNVILADRDDKITKLESSFYSYKLQGRLIDKESKKVKIGDIIIEIDGYIPNDINDNDYISFDVLRVDFFEL